VSRGNDDDHSEGKKKGNILVSLELMSKYYPVIKEPIHPKIS
jgi:hypothetical protein